MKKEIIRFLTGFAILLFLSSILIFLNAVHEDAIVYFLGSIVFVINSYILGSKILK